MAANTDKFKKLARKWVGSIGAGGVADGTVTTIPLSSSSGLPTDTAVVATIDRVDANGIATPSLEESVVGVVSGNNLVTCTRGVEGTAQAHSAGAVVEILVTAKGWNDMVDGFLAEHSQLGAHTTDTISEKTSAAGVTVDGLKLKDGRVVGWDGWMPAEETWTYASATTITVPSGAASKYSKGDKIRLKQGAGYKYFYVVGIADTVLTVTGGSDHTVANAAITDNYYSKVENPQGFPYWFNFTPAWDVNSIDNGSGGQPTNSFDKFMITGKQVFVQIKVSGTKANTTAYIRFQSSHLPNPAYTAGNHAFGSVACNTTSWGGGFFQYTASYHAFTFFSNINDDTTINSATSSYSYEF